MLQNSYFYGTKPRVAGSWSQQPIISMVYFPHLPFMTISSTRCFGDQAHLLGYSQVMILLVPAAVEYCFIIAMLSFDFGFCHWDSEAVLRGSRTRGVCFDWHGAV